MIKKILTNRLGLVAAISLILLASASNAFAWDRPSCAPYGQRVVVIKDRGYHHRRAYYKRPRHRGYVVFVPPVVIRWGYPRLCKR